MLSSGTGIERRGRGAVTVLPVDPFPTPGSGMLGALPEVLVDSLALDEEREEGGCGEVEAEAGGVDVCADEDVTLM